jgi:hypothetical protein
VDFFASSKVLTRTAIAAGVVALGLAAFAPAASAHSAPAKKATINTFKSWDGASAVEPFGCPDSTTYGETITVPANKHSLSKVTFYMNDSGQTGSMVARGEVYAWNGTMATTLVAESKPKTIDLADANYHPVSFKFKNGSVTPGSQYVVFASVDKDYQLCSNYTTAWGSTDGTAYGDGIFVFQNNEGNSGNWTTVAWTPIPTLDAAMKVFLGN